MIAIYLDLQQILQVIVQHDKDEQLSTSFGSSAIHLHGSRVYTYIRDGARLTILKVCPRPLSHEYVFALPTWACYP